MSARRGIRALLMLGLGLAVAACDAGRLNDAGAPGSTRLSLVISAANSAASGGLADAFRKVTQVAVRLTEGAQVRLDQTMSVDATSGEISIPLSIELNAASETMELSVTLSAPSGPLFQGATPLQLRAGETMPVTITLTPLLAGVTVTTGPVLFAAYGDTARLSATALLATGDTIPGLTAVWQSLDPTVASASSSGLVTARSDGVAHIVATVGGSADTVLVTVHAHVAAVAIGGPPVDTIPIDGTVQLTASAKDSRGNPVVGRTVQWKSSDPNVATVDTKGAVTGRSPGTVTINAIVDSASAGVSVVVLNPAPTAITDAVGTVSSHAAVLNGRVNPNGLSTTAWFEWTQDTLSFKGATTSAPESVGSGNGLVPLTFSATGLAGGADYMYRMAASSSAGTSYGSPVRFKTAPSAPLALTDSANISSDYVYANFYGTVNPNGLATTAYIQVGYDPAFVEYDIIGAVALPAGSKPVQISGSEYNYGNTYYYRTVAVNALGESIDAAKSITGPAIGATPIGTAGGRGPTRSDVPPSRH